MNGDDWLSDAREVHRDIGKVLGEVNISLFRLHLAIVKTHKLCDRARPLLADPARHNAPAEAAADVAENIDQTLDYLVKLLRPIDNLEISRLPRKLNTEPAELREHWHRTRAEDPDCPLHETDEVVGASLHPPLSGRQIRTYRLRWT